ncbi:MAG: hypothetical protein J7L82_00920 [Staphylothermus sp.]|nr:hypothetical protein [Staphylothermus sp.]
MSWRKRVVLEWTNDFEQFLRSIKRGRKVGTEETLRRYRNLFKKYLEGKELTEELVNYVAKHRNDWLRIVFRHYARYLYYRRKIPSNLYELIISTVLGRVSRLGIRYYDIKDEDVVRTLEFLKKNNELYYGVYRVLLESGARIKHVLEMIRNWNPDEEVATYGYSGKCLVCFEEKGFCRYYMGLRGTTMPCEWIYFSTDTLKIISKYAPKRIYYNNIARYARRHELLRPSIMRKVSWRIMIETIDRLAALFIQSRFGEISLEEKSLNLVELADREYPKYLKVLNERFFEKIKD